LPHQTNWFFDCGMMSLRWLWRCCLGALLLQAKPCRPRASTALPHTHVWGLARSASKPVCYRNPDFFIWQP